MNLFSHHTMNVNQIVQSFTVISFQFCNLLIVYKFYTSSLFFDKKCCLTYGVVTAEYLSSRVSCD